MEWQMNQGPISESKPRFWADSQKLNLRVTEEDGVRRESYNTPEGQMVDKVETVNWNEKSYLERGIAEIPKIRERSTQPQPSIDPTQAITQQGGIQQMPNYGNTDGISTTPFPTHDQSLNTPSPVMINGQPMEKPLSIPGMESRAKTVNDQPGQSFQSPEIPAPAETQLYPAAGQIATSMSMQNPHAEVPGMISAPAVLQQQPQALTREIDGVELDVLLPNQYSVGKYQPNF